MACEPPDAAGGWIPDWIFCPREKILEVVFSWFFDGLEFFIDETVFAVQTVQGEVIGAFVIAGEQIWDAGADVALIFLALQEFLNSVLLGLAGGAGFAGPIAAALSFAVVVAVVFGALQFATWLLKWVT